MASGASERLDGNVGQSTGVGDAGDAHAESAMRSTTYRKEWVAILQLGQAVVA